MISVVICGFHTNDPMKKKKFYVKCCIIDALTLLNITGSFNIVFSSLKRALSWMEEYYLALISLCRVYAWISSLYTA